MLLCVYALRDRQLAMQSTTTCTHARGAHARTVVFVRKCAYTMCLSSDGMGRERHKVCGHMCICVHTYLFAPRCHLTVVEIIDHV